MCKENIFFKFSHKQLVLVAAPVSTGAYLFMIQLSLMKKGVLSIIICAFFVLAGHASAATYYFNNAVNQDPTELGNYWNDSDQTDPATQLPDFSVDEVTIVSGATFNGSITFNFNAENNGTIEGNAIFHDTSSNNGTVIGDVTFYGDTTQDRGQIIGVKTRYYTTNISPNIGFDATSLVIADGCDVDLSNLEYDDTIIDFITLNGGHFFKQNQPVLPKYYFTNTVDSDPVELGNYWYNSNFTWQAEALPAFSVDRVIVVSGATFNGDIKFNGKAVNNGTITGNAVFNDESVNNGTIEGNAIFKNGSSQNNGTVIGTKTRYFDSTTATSDDFVLNGPWIIVADGLELDARSAKVDSGTIFITLNGGSFKQFDTPRATLEKKEVTLTYTDLLNENSIPNTDDFTILVNGTMVPISSITISGNQVFLLLPYDIGVNDIVTLSYTPNNPALQASGGFLFPSLLNLKVYYTILTNAQALHYSLAIKGRLYVPDGVAGTLSILDMRDDRIVSTISGLYGAYYINAIGNKIYVSGGNKVYIIDALTNTLITTLTVGNGVQTALLSGTKLYVISGNVDSVYIIDTNTDTIIKTLLVGIQPFYAVAVGKYVYVVNTGSNYLSVIDTTTDTLASDISIGSIQLFISVVGTKLYVSTPGTNSVTVVDTLTNTVIKVIPINTSSFYSNSVGNEIYIGNYGGTPTVTVINSLTDSITATIQAGQSPYSSQSFGSKVYVPNLDASGVGHVTVIDVTTHTVSDTIEIEAAGYYVTVGDSKVYATSPAKGVHIIDPTTLPSLLPNLVSFSTSASSGTYSAGQTISLTAHFGRPLASGSTMTVHLNSGGSAILNQVSGATLSGTYTIGVNDTTPDLAIDSITSASVTDATNTYTRTLYDLPSSQGSFTAENSFITRNLGDTINIKVGSYQSFNTGSHPYQVSAPINGYLYVANQGANTVSVINASTGTTTTTIPVGSEPYGLTTATIASVPYLYVANTGSDTVSVINTQTNTVTATISVGVKPYYLATIGTNVYVTNGQSNTVSVINATINTVTATIPVGSYPRGIKAHGTDLYVANYGDPNYSGGNSVSVIDSLTNQVTTTIILPGGSDGPRGVTVLGNKVYVANFRSNSVSVIDTATNQVTATIPVGEGPRGIIGLGTTVYVENFDEGTISVIDTLTNTVTKTITVGHSPAGMSLSGTDLYLSAFQDDRLYVLDTTTNTLRAQPAVVTTPAPITISGGMSAPASSPAPVPPATLPPPPFTRSLRLGMRGEDVRRLQQYLNTHHCPVTLTGIGSKGKESTYFGQKTRAAVICFQNMNKQSILEPLGLKAGTGIVGALTAGYIAMNP